MGGLLSPSTGVITQQSHRHHCPSTVGASIEIPSTSFSRTSQPLSSKHAISQGSTAKAASTLYSILHPPLSVDRLNPPHLSSIRDSIRHISEPAAADAYNQVLSEVGGLDRELEARASKFEVPMTGTLDAMLTFERPWPKALTQRGLHNYTNSAVSVSSSHFLTNGRSGCRLSALMSTMYIGICTVTGNPHNRHDTRDGRYITGYRSWMSGKTTNME